MVWFKVDDGLSSHPKVLSIQRGNRRLAAVGAWALAGSWCARHPAQNGVIPAAVLDDLGVPARVAADIVAAGLWVEVPGGFRFHDFHDYNPTGQQVDADRAAARERQQRARQRARERKSVTEVSRRDAPVTSRERHGPPDPTRPDPTRTSFGSSRTETADAVFPSTAVEVGGARRATAAGSFDAFWSAYPRKVGKRAAAAAYARACSLTTPAALLAAAARFAADPTRDPAFTPHPATWLNQGRYDDEGPARPASTANRTDERTASHLALVERFAAAEHHQPELGA